MTDAKYIDHEYTDEPICPHCGASVRDAWELPSGKEIELDCECGGVFVAEDCIERTWTTAKKDYSHA